MKGEVIGLGNALVDLLTSIESDDLLVQLGMPKGSMQLVDEVNMQRVLDATKNLKRDRASGGSAANTISGMAMLGVKTGYIGKVGRDETGEFFRRDMEKAGITPVLLEGKAPSGVAIGLISYDSERTFATYLGAAIELIPEDLTASMFHGYEYFHIEGYLVQNQQLVRRAMELAKQEGLKITLDLASYNVVESNLEFLKEVVEKYVNIVFANEEEARSFTGMEPPEAVVEISKICDIAVVKVGMNGSYIRTDNVTHKVEAVRANSIDSTGAGDLYAAGFLYGLLQGYPMDICGTLGSVLAANVIEVMGPKMNDERWAQINQIVRKTVIKK
ncbi:MAG TPA: adenosine kinase [Williamwhitmania sp.]|nr:adenosine kinase [Williamwhitmania sp.]